MDNINIINTSSRLFCEGLKIDFYENCPDPDWDNFLSHLPGAHIEQTSLWASFRAHYGWRSVRWVVRENEQIVGGIQMLLCTFLRAWQIGYVVRGPHVLGSHRPVVDEVLVDLVLKYARKNRPVYLVFELPYGGEGIANLLDQRGFILHPKGIPPSGLMTATLVLDLRVGVEDLMKGMLPSVRRKVRIGIKSGLEVTLGGREHLDIFWNLMLAICARRGSSPTPPSRIFLKGCGMLWKIMDG